MSESDLNGKRLEQLNIMLKNDKWFGRKPYRAMSMKEAVQAVTENKELIIASCAWWGHLPAGWTWCEVLEAIAHNAHYRVMQSCEPKDIENFIPQDEPVLVFYRNVFCDKDV